MTDKQSREWQRQGFHMAIGVVWLAILCAAALWAAEFLWEKIR